jgi:DNA-binding transcriptional ArsR family regulator
LAPVERGLAGGVPCLQQPPALMFDLHRTSLFDKGQTTVSRVTITPIEVSCEPDLASVDIASLLQALSDPVRLTIVRQLDEAGSDGLTCGQLDVPVGKSTCSHHLKVLLHAGVTAEREEGTRKHVRLRRDELDARFPGVVGSVLGAVSR